MVSLFRQIILSNPPIQVLNMNRFSGNTDVNVGELVLEALLNSKILSIQDLNLDCNYYWFKHPSTEERSENVDLLAELITKQAGL